MPNGDLTSDSQKKADILNKFFVRVFEKKGNENLPDFQDHPFTDTLCSIKTQESKLEKQWIKLKEPNLKILKHAFLVNKKCKKVMLTPLKIIFTKYLKEEKIPEIWKNSNIFSIPKSC